MDKLKYIAVAVGVIACIVFLGSQYIDIKKFYTRDDVIVTVDLKSIVNQKRNEIIEKYKGAYTAENAKKAEQELQLFQDKIYEGIRVISPGQTVLLKEVVISDSADITDKLTEYLRKK